MSVMQEKWKHIRADVDTFKLVTRCIVIMFNVLILFILYL